LKEKDETYGAEEPARRRDEVIRRMASTCRNHLIIQKEEVPQRNNRSKLPWSVSLIER
jgi:hypothetical protein